MGQRRGFDLEMEVNPRQQHGEWLMQRVMSLLLSALLVVIVLGLLGRGGPLSDVDVRVGNGAARIRYDRFMRNHSPDKLRVTAQAHSDKVRMRLDSGYLDRIEMQQVTPQPERVIAEEGAVEFVFNARPGAEMHAEFQFVPNGPGSLQGWIQVETLPRQSLDHFIYP